MIGIGLLLIRQTKPSLALTPNYNPASYCWMESRDADERHRYKSLACVCMLESASQRENVPIPEFIRLYHILELVLDLRPVLFQKLHKRVSELEHFVIKLLKIYVIVLARVVK